MHPILPAQYPKLINAKHGFQKTSEQIQDQIIVQMKVVTLAPFSERKRLNNKKRAYDFPYSMLDA